MKGLLKYFSERGSFPALVTVVSTFVAALIIGELSAFELLCVVGIVGLQFYFQLHNQFFCWLVPIEWLSDDNALKPVAHYRRINWMLAGLPCCLWCLRICPRLCL